jgi:hypothetical protein
MTLQTGMHAAHVAVKKPHLVWPTMETKFSLVEAGHPVDFKQEKFQ